MKKYYPYEIRLPSIPVTKKYGHPDFSSTPEKYPATAQKDSAPAEIRETLPYELKIYESGGTSFQTVLVKNKFTIPLPDDSEQCIKTAPP